MRPAYAGLIFLNLIVLELFYEHDDEHTSFADSGSMV
jgi:hypothetical protein